MLIRACLSRVRRHSETRIPAFAPERAGAAS